MFKTKYRLVDSNWTNIYTYKSRVKPSEGEYIYVEDHKSYYRVKTVIHSLMKLKRTVLVVEKVDNIK